jgi:ankyrin repeat protein
MPLCKYTFIAHSCLERGASADATYRPLGNTACHLAAVTGNCDIILLLLKHGASLRVLDSQGRSPLHLAAWSGKAACVKLLLDNAMDMLNAKTRCHEDKNQVHQEVLDLWSHDQVCTKNEVSGHDCNTEF